MQNCCFVQFVYEFIVLNMRKKSIILLIKSIMLKNYLTLPQVRGAFQ